MVPSPLPMSDMEDIDTGLSILPLSTNPMYKDVVPVPQDDGPVPVVTIIYTEECN